MFIITVKVVIKKWEFIVEIFLLTFNVLDIACL